MMYELRQFILDGEFNAIGEVCEDEDELFVKVKNLFLVVSLPDIDMTQDYPNFIPYKLPLTNQTIVFVPYVVGDSTTLERKIYRKSISIDGPVSDEMSLSYRVNLTELQMQQDDIKAEMEREMKEYRKQKSGISLDEDDNIVPFSTPPTKH